MNNSKQFIECSEEIIKDNLIEIPEIIYDQSIFEIKGSKIKVKKEGTVNLNFKYKENKPFQKIISKENEITYCPSFIKYFEITLNDIDESAISIGVISSPDKLKKQRMVGWDKRTIVLHNDGKIYNENDYNGVEATQPLKKNDIIGCGFNLITNEIFFTVNGKLIEKKFTLFGEELCHAIGFENYENKIIQLILEIKNHLNMILFHIYKHF